MATRREHVVLTVGHGTLSGEELSDLLHCAAVAVLVDVRSMPRSRHNPQFERDVLTASLPAAGIAYRWERELGGFRRPSPSSPNVALRHPAFRGYADWMAGERFRAAIQTTVAEARRERLALMCSESVWWRCHRRLIADYVALCVDGVEPRHLLHDGSIADHRITDGARREGDRVVYDVGFTQPLPTDG
jgi:uncharacterized protein (DUF488 family)